jgi:hypothetical protein
MVVIKSINSPFDEFIENYEDNLSISQDVISNMIELGFNSIKTKGFIENQLEVANEIDIILKQFKFKINISKGHIIYIYFMIQEFSFLNSWLPNEYKSFNEVKNLTELLNFDSINNFEIKINKKKIKLDIEKSLIEHKLLIALKDALKKFKADALDYYHWQNNSLDIPETRGRKKDKLLNYGVRTLHKFFHLNKIEGKNGGSINLLIGEFLILFGLLEYPSEIDLSSKKERTEYFTQKIKGIIR